MALNLKALTKNMLSKRTFDQVSYYGTFCGEIKTSHRFITHGKPGLEYVKVVKQYYYYLDKLWAFTIIDEHNHPLCRWGDLQKASWESVENN